MLTSFADDEALFASILAGAAGYVLKQIRGEELVTAIRRVGQGVSARLRSARPSGPGPSRHRTPRSPPARRLRYSPT
jgi:two-component system response regulator DevR